MKKNIKYKAILALLFIFIAPFNLSADPVAVLPESHGGGVQPEPTNGNDGGKIILIDQRRCPLYSFELYRTNKTTHEVSWQTEAGWTTAEMEQNYLQWTKPSGRRLSCLDQHIERARTACTAHRNMYSGISSKTLYDECMSFGYFMQHPDFKYYNFTNNPKLQALGPRNFEPAFMQCSNGDVFSNANLRNAGLVGAVGDKFKYSCMKGSTATKDLVETTGVNLQSLHRTSDNTATDSFPRSLVFYVDANCQSVVSPSIADANSACKELTLMSRFWESPISLIWDQATDVDAQISIAKFKLNPHSENSWYIWKASAKTPLLVYDPEHRGQITSAHQLFGNWTFGGKKFASLDQNSTSSGDSAWQNGFEALATLDANLNGEISGSELAPLALWFDKSQNGVSEKGEVQPITKTGITRLWYKTDFQDPLTKSVVASRGFEREISGIRRVGKAVDWYGDGALDETSLIYKLSQETQFCKLAGKKIAADRSSPDSSANSELAAANSEELSKVRGVWKWNRISDADGTTVAGGGYLSITPTEGEKFFGYSISELYLPKEGRKSATASTISMQRLEGRIEIDADNVKKIRFTLDGKEEMNVRSSAIIGDNGNNLTGQTTVQGTYLKRPINISYRWTAQRIE